MAEDEASHDSTRPRGWSRLRGKIQDKALLAFKKQSDRSTDDDVNDFLGKPSSGSPDSADANSIASTDSRRSVPRITTARNLTQPPEWATRPEDLEDGRWRPTKPPRRLGLVVNFDTADPIVIGEGGHNSEDPPALIAQYNTTSHHARPRAATGSSENTAIRRKATTATHLHSKSSSTEHRPQQPLHDASRQPTLPDLSNPSFQGELPPISDIPPLPTTSTQRRPVPIIRTDPLFETPQDAPHRAPHTSHDVPSLQVTNLAPKPDADNTLRSPSSPSAQRIFEMRAEEGMAHRRSIRSASDVQGPVPRHSPSSSVSSLDATDQMIASNDTAVSASSSRPTSQHSRYAVSPEPTAFEAEHYPIAPTKSASSGHHYLSPPGSSHGAGPPNHQNVPLRPAADQVVRPSRGASLQQSNSTETSVLQDVAPPPYGAPPPLGVVPNAQPPPSVLTPQVAPQPPPPSQRVETPAIVTSAKPGSGTVAPQPRRPSNRQGLYQFDDEPSTVPTISQDPPSVSSSPERYEKRPRPTQSVPAALRNLEAPRTVVPPLQSPPYTASVAPPSYPVPPSQQSDGFANVSAHSSVADGDEAVGQFSQFANGASSTFNLSAASDGGNYSTLQWQYCALWWFMKARSGLESLARESQPGSSSDRDIHSLRQHHVNLAKAWWVAKEILPAQISMSAPSPDHESARGVIDALMAGFLSLCTSMKKRNILPPPQYIVSGVDQTIWTSHPFSTYPSEWTFVLNGSSLAPDGRTPRAAPLEVFPVSDARSTYCYGRVFARGSVAQRGESPSLPPFECAVSVVRSKTSPELEVMICSQTTECYVAIREMQRLGIHWTHTKFEHEVHGLLIKLPQRVDLWLQCSPRDYAWLWSCYDNSQKITRSMRPRSDEIELATYNLATFAYRDSAVPDEFPDKPMDNCRMALFQRVHRPEERDKRIAHRGYRLAIFTTGKIIQNVTFAVGSKAPLQFAWSSSKPDFRLQLNEMERGRSAHLTFFDGEMRDHFGMALTGLIQQEGEKRILELPVKDVKSGAVVKGVSTSQWTSLRYHKIKVIDHVDIDNQHGELSACDLSENLRVVLSDMQGTVVDRMCDAVTEVRIRCEADEPNALQVMRPTAREDLTISIGPEQGAEGPLRHAFDTAMSVPSGFWYEFPDQRSMHQFQRTVTGYKVLYDCVPSAFVITRRQMYVGKDKDWKTRNPRILIVERDMRHQLVAFFNDYVVADSLNFEMKKMDTFEQTTGSKSSGHGIHGMKLVDAKFTLPGSNKDDWLRDGASRDATARYTNMATEEYAAEHDDILIYFDSEEDRDRFGDFLPAPVTKARSKFNLMRRI